METSMSNKYQALCCDISDLESRMRLSKNKDEFRRFQSIWLRVSKGLSVSEIASATCYSASWIRQLHSLYKHGGSDAIAISEKGGRYNENMSKSEEDIFIKPFLEAAKAGGILEVSGIHSALEKKLGREIKKSVVYRLLHRYDWRKIAPRPTHPKTDKDAQETFKKTGLLSLQKRKKAPY
jgi:transposase